MKVIDTVCAECGRLYNQQHKEDCTQNYVNTETGGSLLKPDDPIIKEQFINSEEYNRMFKDPLKEQTGGSHYKKLVIQPMEYCMANNLNYCQSTAIKYITRYKDKGGAEDICKAIHTLNILLKLEYGTSYDECKGE